MKFTLHR